MTWNMFEKGGEEHDNRRASSIPAPGVPWPEHPIPEPKGPLGCAYCDSLEHESMDCPQRPPPMIRQTTTEDTSAVGKLISSYVEPVATEPDPVVTQVIEDMKVRPIVRDQFARTIDAACVDKTTELLWLRHAYEAALDQACYLKAAILSRETRP